MMTGLQKRFDWLTIAQRLFFVNAGIWLLLGIVSLVRLANGRSTPSITLLVIAILMFGNVAALLFAGLTIKKPQRVFIYLAMAVLIVNIVLTVTDQFGIIDLLTMLLDFVILGVLLVGYRSRLKS